MKNSRFKNSFWFYTHGPYTIYLTVAKHCVIKLKFLLFTKCKGYFWCCNFNISQIPPIILKLLILLKDDKYIWFSLKLPLHKPIKKFNSKNYGVFYDLTSRLNMSIPSISFLHWYVACSSKLIYVRIALILIKNWTESSLLVK